MQPRSAKLAQECREPSWSRAPRGNPQHNGRGNKEQHQIHGFRPAAAVIGYLMSYAGHSQTHDGHTEKCARHVSTLAVENLSQTPGHDCRVARLQSFGHEHDRTRIRATLEDEDRRIALLERIGRGVRVYSRDCGVDR